MARRRIDGKGYWDSARGVYVVGPNETKPWAECFPHDSLEVGKALEYARRWSKQTSAGCLLNAILCVQKHGRDEDWLDLETLLSDKYHLTKERFELRKSFIDQGIAFGTDLDGRYISRYCPTDDYLRADQFSVEGPTAH